MLGICRHLASYGVLTISSIDDDGRRAKVNDLALGERSSLWDQVALKPGYPFACVR